MLAGEIKKATKSSCSHIIFAEHGTYFFILKYAYNDSTDNEALACNDWALCTG